MIDIVYKFLEQSNRKATAKWLDISGFRELILIWLTCFSIKYIFLYIDDIFF